MRLNNLFKPKDSSGRESRTLFFVAVSIWFVWIANCLILYRFATDHTVSISDMTQGFVVLAGVIVTIIGIWLGREWINSKRGSKDV